MSITLKSPPARTARRQAPGRTPDATTIEVVRGAAFVGAVVLSEDERVTRCGPDVPKDVVLKVLVAVTRRDETSGRVRGRKDGLTYGWQVIGADETGAA